MTAELLILAAAGLATYLLRASFLGFAGGWQPPATVDRLLVHARPAVMTALLATMIASRTTADVTLVAPYAVGMALAGVVAWRTRNLAWTLVAGLVTFAAIDEGAAPVLAFAGVL